MNEIAITPDAYTAVLEACQSACPAEVCGHIGARQAVLVRAYPVPNVAQAAPGKCRFLMDSRSQLHTMREIEDTGLDLGGHYHSHPRTAAVPSETDVHLAAYPEAVHLIVGLRYRAQPEVRAWRIVDGMSEELALRIASDPPQQIAPK